MIVISMCNQMVPKGSGNYQRLEKTRMRLFANFTRIPFDYPLTSWVTNYVSNREFLMCYPGSYRWRTPLSQMLRP